MFAQLLHTFNLIFRIYYTVHTYVYVKARMGNLFHVANNELTFQNINISKNNANETMHMQVLRGSSIIIH